MFSSGSRPRHAPSVLEQASEGTAVLLDLYSGEYFSLNEVGNRIWQLCDGSRSLAEVVQLLADEYQAPREILERDVLRTLETFADARLVQVAPEQTAP